MRVFLLAIISIIFFSHQTVAGPIINTKIPKHPVPLGKITVTNPHRGNHFITGNTMIIQWKSIGYIPDKCVSISLFRGVNYVKQLTYNTCTNGFRWKIPSNFTAGQYKIRLTTKDKKVIADSAMFPIISSKPNLSVRRFYTNPRTTYEGNMVKLKFEILNSGGSKTGRLKVETKIYKPDGKIYGPVHTTEVESVPALGGRRTISVPIQLDEHQSGKYTVKIKLDTENRVQESNENDNTATYYFTAEPLADLVVCVDTNKRPRPFKKVTIRAYVINMGDAASKPCNLLIAVRDDYRFKMQKYNRSIPSIKPHEIYSSAHVRYKWYDLSNKGKYFYVFVDNRKQVKESNETNNFASGYYYLTRPGGKHGDKNKVSCSWFGPAPVDKSTVGIK